MITQFSVLTVTRPAVSRGGSRFRWFSMITPILWVWLACAAVSCFSRPCQAQATMTIQVVDDKTGEPIACRVELRDAKGRPQKTRGAMNHLPWSIVDGQFVFRGKAGDYLFDVHHGPEFAGGGGGFTLDKDGEGSDVVRLPRHANLRDEGYLAGDLLAQLPPAEVVPWLPAESLQMAAAITAANDIKPVNDIKPADESESAKKSEPGQQASQDGQSTKVKTTEKGAWYSTGNYYDDRPVKGGLMLHNWMPPAPVPEELPSTRLLVMAKQEADCHAEIARLWARDTPVWLASGRIDSIQI
ncbi:MAG: hypothetical protein IT423_11320, partial [Pirellulaceae bacterium]|nr:hypothetical protein [Pirellulaceae bacterium]